MAAIRPVMPPRLFVKLVAGLMSTNRSRRWGAEHATLTPKQPPKDSATRMTLRSSSSRVLTLRMSSMACFSSTAQLDLLSEGV